MFSVTPLMKNMYTVGVLVHGVHHTLLISHHWFEAISHPFRMWVIGIDGIQPPLMAGLDALNQEINESICCMVTDKTE